MTQLTTTLLAAACLQLLLTGHVLSSGDHAGWTSRQCTAGLRQSPVDITSVGLKEEKMEPLIFDLYDAAFLPAIFLRDWRVVLRPYEGQEAGPPSVRGGDLKGNYVVAGLHFHWNAEGQGSEHLLEGRQFDGEMHIVHYNDKYGSLENAREHSDGLAVLAVWLETEQDTLSGKEQRENAGYQWMKDLADTYLSKRVNEYPISKDSSNFLFNETYLENLLPTDRSHFFRYNGSLTTNPCSETVTWTIFRSPITVPKEFMTMLYLKETTVRAPQPLNNRTIFYGGDMASYYSGAGLAPTSSGFWSLLPLLALLKMAL